MLCHIISWLLTKACKAGDRLPSTISFLVSALHWVSFLSDCVLTLMLGHPPLLTTSINLERQQSRKLAEVSQPSQIKHRSIASIRLCVNFMWSICFLDSLFFSFIFLHFKDFLSWEAKSRISGHFLRHPEIASNNKNGKIWRIMSRKGRFRITCSLNVSY